MKERNRFQGGEAARLLKTEPTSVSQCMNNLTPADSWLQNSSAPLLTPHPLGRRGRFETITLHYAVQIEKGKYKIQSQ
jgi:hypothetical protein